MSGLFSSDAFKNALRQFDAACDMLQLSDNTRERLRFPQRTLIVSCPVRMDDGSVKVYTGYRVQHNLTLGPCKGGVRYHPDVDMGEIAALAMNMSWKCGLAELPFSGAKGGIAVDPLCLSQREIEALTRRYTAEIFPIIGPQKDIPAPDMGTNEQTMAWMMDTFSMHEGYSVPTVVTGKPLVIGGSLGRKEATGYGVAYIAEQALKMCDRPIQNARIVIQGYGNVGFFTAVKLAKMGARIIAFSDVHGGAYNESGFSYEELKNATSPRDVKGDKITNEELLQRNCDVLIPAAIGGVLTKKNAAKIKARIIIEAGNGVTTTEADEILLERNIFVVPDILANAGGVIVSFLEYVQGTSRFTWTRMRVFSELQKRMLGTFSRVSDWAQEHHVTFRTAALMLGVKRVAEAKELRGMYA